MRVTALTAFAGTALVPRERHEGTLAVRVAIVGKLTPGRYKVTWKTAAADGQPSRGSFGFVVLARAIRSLAPAA